MSGNVARSTLEAQRIQALDAMVYEADVARRKELRQLVSAFEVAIASLPPDQSQIEFGRFKRVRDAIKEYLASANRPVRADQIVDALLDGGLRRKPEGRKTVTPEEMIEHTRSVIRKSISFHLVNPRGVNAEIIKEVNGKIGLWAWPDEKFQ